MGALGCGSRQMVEVLSVPSVVRKGGREEDQELVGGPKERHSHSLSSQAGPPWSLASPWDPQDGSKLLGS